MPAGSFDAAPPRMIPKPRPSHAASGPSPESGKAEARSIESQHDEGPELLDLEDLEPTSQVAQSPPLKPASEPASAVPLRDAHSPDPEEIRVDREAEGPRDAQDLMIEKFNSMHRIVYSAVRTEIGAGAVNFVRSCCGKFKDDVPDLLEGVELQADGSWDPKALKNVIVELKIEDPWSAYEQLLDREFVLLAPHLGQARAEKLKERILAIQQGKGA
jgi:hypothetical protein